MKKQRSLIISLCLTLLFISCDKTESFDDQWQLDNEEAFAKIAANTKDYSKINSQSTAGYIMYKELESGDGETPTFGQRVNILFSGWYKRDWSLNEDSYTDENGNFIQNKITFASSNRTDIPSTLLIDNSKVGLMTDGLATALQNMQVGDKWEIWIPWNLGFGASDYQGYGIKGYTTLVFEVELVSIVDNKQ